MGVWGAVVSRARCKQPCTQLWRSARTQRVWAPTLGPSLPSPGQAASSRGIPLNPCFGATQPCSSWQARQRSPHLPLTSSDSGAKVRFSQRCLKGFFAARAQPLTRQHQERGGCSPQKKANTRMLTICCCHLQVVQRAQVTQQRREVQGAHERGVGHLRGQAAQVRAAAAAHQRGLRLLGVLVPAARPRCGAMVSWAQQQSAAPTRAPCAPQRTSSLRLRCRCARCSGQLSAAPTRFGNLPACAPQRP